MITTRRVSVTLQLVACVALSGSAPAQFGAYTWHLSGDPSGSGTVTEDQMHVVGPADEACTTQELYAFLSTTTAQSGTVSAHYFFDNQDGGFGWYLVEDPAYVVDGVQHLVGPGDIFYTWEGDVSFHVEAGQSFGFGVVSADCYFGPGVLDVTAFVFTPDAWQDLGQGLAGTYGTPPLHGLGTLQPGSPYTLSLVDAATFAPAWLIIGVAPFGAPFKGGVLVPDPSPPGLLLLLNTGPGGRIILEGNWPAGLPSGLALYFQYWIADAAGPLGWAASNALKATMP
ncbi:MAG TPA: hypothetical protein VFD43_10730 [Planctomycetota bacterium]|nr:hypothetical protein [Planctomycetota bacterium]